MRNQRSNSAATLVCLFQCAKRPRIMSWGSLTPWSAVRELGAGQRVEREQQPVGDEDQDRDGELNARSLSEHQEERMCIRGRSAPARS